MDFIYQTQAMRVRFGAGERLSIAAEIEALNFKKVLIVCTERETGIARDIAASIPDQVVGIYNKAMVHVPEATVQEAMELAKDLGADSTISVGGGSSIGLSKMLSLNMGLPSISVATTYAGSEMTPIWGSTKGDEKTTGRDPSIKPVGVIYDPELTMTLPMFIAGPSGLNAIAHAVEALWAVDANPVTDLMAEEGVRAMNSALSALAVNDQDETARADALYGAWLCGTVLGQCSMAIHHKLCHVLGGAFNLPHAELHAVVLPYAVAYTAPGAPKAMAALGRALGVAPDEVAGKFWDLREQLGSPGSLEALGVPHSGLARAKELALKNPYSNPVPVNAEGIESLLEQMFAGRRP